MIQTEMPPVAEEAIKSNVQNNDITKTAVNSFSLPDLPSGLKGADEKEGKESVRDRLAQLVVELGCELFHDRAANTFVTVRINGHNENWKMRSEGFVRYLRHQWHQANGSGVSSSVLNEVIDTLDAQAAYSDNERETHVRVAHANDKIYVDLCDQNWSAVEIDQNGWRIVSEPAVKFVRSQGMSPLPTPLKGGSLNQLRQFINAPTVEIWTLTVAWVLGAFSPGPFPILITLGEQGCAKTFLCNVLRALVDPSEVPVVSAPRETRDVIFAAQNSHVLALDNMSNVNQQLSDLLCGIATGAAHRERKYHTNNGDEQLFRARRPILINGIDFGLKDDLLSRALLVTLPVISEEDRRDEKELWSEANQALPEILGGLFDILSRILRALPTVTLEKKPRMADFARWITAAEAALGWTDGHFMNIYAGNRDAAVEIAIDSDPFGSALRDFMLDRDRPEWRGGWEQLLEHLRGDDKYAKGWPNTSKSLTTRLKRLAPALRHYGIHWEEARIGNRRVKRIWRVDQ